jgi:hypothetical protein
MLKQSLATSHERDAGYLRMDCKGQLQGALLRTSCQSPFPSSLTRDVRLL